MTLSKQVTENTKRNSTYTRGALIQLGRYKKFTPSAT